MVNDSSVAGKLLFQRLDNAFLVKLLRESLVKSDMIDLGIWWLAALPK